MQIYGILLDKMVSKYVDIIKMIKYKYTISKYSNIIDYIKN